MHLILVSNFNNKHAQHYRMGWRLIKLETSNFIVSAFLNSGCLTLIKGVGFKVRVLKLETIVRLECK